ncbi:RNA chaperone ProQ [Shewanella glacialipiscicola]|uniref:RNA chaperone ProQ n=1 Tax=Shewanella glacialipiscicola TaxID=614069 RepID=A0ABQ6J627_9GAMM|nr:RNA chaperone ProQ [Shewanella glacialipiscicola]MCL1084689.1 RNA chaperone ProQ [Shewanella glacialipiscicola]MCU7995209.1 RNA chaperone ProQ [Shewanella glacialipiscicola]MCU8026552.1 RNA chaperone ProQ [Shewanella glacialipiscicola]GIU13628.1 RNA chaperone ProQ [Shewanella glacialipiscicola]GMA82367.1 RNA chaperone ProQ [Shewanella glacialipiscicola]
MESTEKLTDTNAILAYLYETFPLCFIAEGETKPLKIGLFQDLAERLADDSKVSKTQLRVALRRYTSSWRYLKSVKAGAQRVNLDGEPCGELEQEHIDHAQAMLKESQEKAKAKRAALAPKPAAKKAPKKVAAPQRPKTERPAKPAPKAAAPVVNYVQAQLTDLTKKQRVNVKLGMTPVAGVITDINKEDIHVQLDSGLTIKVRAEHILL